MQLQYSKIIDQDIRVFLDFLKGKYKLFHLSNIFFRDIHYGIWNYLEGKGIQLLYHEAEEVAVEVIQFLERKNIFRRLDARTWVLMYPRYKLEPVKITLTINPKQTAWEEYEHEHRTKHN